MDFTKSKAAFEQAYKVIPGGVNSPVRAFRGVGGTPVFIERGEGAYIYDIDGNRYIDFVQSWGPLIFGHADPETVVAVGEAAKKGLSFGAPTLAETELACEVLEVFGFCDKVRFVSSGTEAVMSAIRLARGFTGRDDIVKFKGCYHGHSDSLLVQAGSGATTFGSPSSPGAPAELVSHTLLAEYNDIESVKRCFAESKSGIACVIIEPIAGNMGFVPSEAEFLKQLREVCDRYGALLIFDEVMSGFRAALGGGCEVYGVTPDIVTLGKVIGGGMPVGAFAAKAEIMSHLSPEGSVYQAGTLSGNPVAMAAGLSVIRRLKADKAMFTKLMEKSKKLVDGIKAAADELGVPLQIGAIGSMFGFFFCATPVKSYTDALKSDTALFAKFHRAMLERGVYLACSQFEAGFMATVITDEMISQTIEAAKDALKSIR